MDWITEDIVRTVAGASLIVALVTFVVKKIIPGVSGRGTQIAALICAMVIGVAIGKWNTPMACVLSIVNGLVIFAAALGWDNVVNYGK